MPREFGEDSHPLTVKAPLFGLVIHDLRTNNGSRLSTVYACARASSTFHPHPHTTVNSSGLEVRRPEFSLGFAISFKLEKVPFPFVSIEIIVFCFVLVLCSVNTVYYID